MYNFPLSSADVAAHYTAATLTNFDTNMGNAIQLAFQNDGNNSQAIPPVAAGPVSGELMPSIQPDSCPCGKPLASEAKNAAGRRVSLASTRHSVSVTAWCASHGVLASDVKVEQRTLEDVFVDLTGTELRP